MMSVTATGPLELLMVLLLVFRVTEKAQGSATAAHKGLFDAACTMWRPVAPSGMVGASVAACSHRHWATSGRTSLAPHLVALVLF